jgi:response regulator RpfG family c-di-GMP phosphodiesterase
MTARPLVLCLDDEPNVLRGLERTLRHSYEVVTTTEPQEALDSLAGDHGNRIAVIISDLRMPQMDGIAVLEKAKHVAPLTTRVLLTGDADVTGALAAVNQGHVFRIILKPCPQDDLESAIAAGTEQHRLIHAERELLEATLKGCVDALMDTLGLAQPALYSRAGRLRRLVGVLCSELGMADGWQVEMAAQMGEIGAITLAPLAMAMLERGTADGKAEAAMLTELQTHADDVLARIPRLETVREIVRFQRPTARTHATAMPADAPEGARVLQAAREYDSLVWRGTSPQQAVSALFLRGTHSDGILCALAALAAAPDTGPVVRKIESHDLGAELTSGQAPLDAAAVS